MSYIMELFTKKKQNMISINLLMIIVVLSFSNFSLACSVASLIDRPDDRERMINVLQAQAKISIEANYEIANSTKSRLVSGSILIGNLSITRGFGGRPNVKPNDPSYFCPGWFSYSAKFVAYSIVENFKGNSSEPTSELVKHCVLSKRINTLNNSKITYVVENLKNFECSDIK